MYLPYFPVVFVGYLPRERQGTETKQEAAGEAVSGSLHAEAAQPVIFRGGDAETKKSLNELGISTYSAEYLCWDPISVLVTDTRSSDLTIADPCRYIADFVALALGVRAHDAKCGALNSLYRHFRDVTNRQRLLRAITKVAGSNGGQAFFTALGVTPAHFTVFVQNYLTDWVQEEQYGLTCATTHIASSFPSFAVLIHIAANDIQTVLDLFGCKYLHQLHMEPQLKLIVKDSLKVFWASTAELLPQKIDEEGVTLCFYYIPIVLNMPKIIKPPFCAPFLPLVMTGSAEVATHRNSLGALIWLERWKSMDWLGQF